MTAQDEAKQLDSVTDRVTEQESMDASKAKDAMASLTSSAEFDARSKKLAKIEVSKEDIAVIVEELEVTDDKAEQALKTVIARGLAEGQTALGEALGMLITS